MKETQQGELTIFRLSVDEYENAVYKNECLCNLETDYIVYVAGDSVEDSELVKAVQRLQETGGSSVAVFCRGRQEELLDYAGVFGLVSVSIDALLFPREVIQRTGAFNARLRAQTSFELLCRLVRETDSCILLESEREPDAANRMVNTETDTTDDRAYTCAYIIRQHLQHLHALGLMEQVFLIFSEAMQEEGVFPVFQQNMNVFLANEKEFEYIARQTAPFIVLRGNNDACGGVLQQFADDLCVGLAEAGQAVIGVDKQFEEYERLQNMVCKGVVGFQASALNIDYFKNMHCPKFQFWFDNPLYFAKNLWNLPQDYWILCQDAGYAALIQKYFHTVNSVQFPPGGKMGENVQIERSYDIIFVGSCAEDDSEILEGNARIFYDYMLEHPLLTFEQGLLALLPAEDVEDKMFFVRTMDALQPAARMVIGHYRLAVISTILEAGFTLHVYGDGWENYRGAGRERLVIHPQVTVEESLEELSKAKIGLNIMSWHKDGMTERIANIMLSGAVCLTEETAYLREHMKDGEEIVCFQLDKLSELPSQIAWLLDHPEERERIAGNAYQKALAEHTWKCRARQLIDLAEKICL